MVTVIEDYWGNRLYLEHNEALRQVEAGKRMYQITVEAGISPELAEVLLVKIVQENYSLPKRKDD